MGPNIVAAYDGAAGTRSLSIWKPAAEGRTVLVSSHLMSEMALTADHMIVIGKGRLIAAAATQEFIDQSSEQSVLVRSRDHEALAQRIIEFGGTAERAIGGGLDVAGIPSARSPSPSDHRGGADAQGGVAGGGVHGNDPR